MLVVLGAVQHALELLDERLPPLRVGPAQQLLGFLPRQLEAVQGRADRLATAEAAEALTHQQHQPLEGDARRWVGPFYGWRGRRALGGADGVTKSRRNLCAKGGSAAGAAKPESIRTLGVIGVHPTHDGLGMASSARGHARGATALRDLVEGERALAGAGMRRAHRQVAQVLGCPTPARIINA
jgi:hypothetical protein